MIRKGTGFLTALMCLVVLQVGATGDVQAGTYPTNQCVSKKTKAAGKYCQGVLKAWSKYHKSPASDPIGDSREAAIVKAFDKLSSAWTKAEDSAAKKDAECVETTATNVQVQSAVETAIDNLQATFGLGADKADESCRSKILGAAAKLCSGLLGANSKFIKAPAKDLERVKLGSSETKASGKFGAGYAKAAPGCTTVIPTSGDVETAVESIRDQVVSDTTTSPNAPTAFTQVIPGSTVSYNGDTLRPKCSRNTPYSFFYKRGTENKLLMYYQGGGACWSALNCWSVPTYKIDADADDNPELAGTGFASRDNVLNIFKDWHVVFVSYCTGDVHWGESYDTFYGPGQLTQHVGRVNAAVAEKWARERFLDPEVIVETGSSAGSYGAIMNSTYLMAEVYPHVQHNVIGDAGIGVIRAEFLDPNTGDNINRWNVEKNLPTFIPGIELPISELSIPEIFEAMGNAFPNNRFASYQSAYDGGNGGQTSFYHIMKNLGNIFAWPNWWEDQCEWTACMRHLVQETSTRLPSNFRYYTGAGSRHTIYGSDKLYHDTRGTVPPITFRDWVDAMVNDDVGWANVDCSDGGDCDLVDTCQGGPNAGLPCTDDVIDCGAAGTACVLNECVGGIDDGLPCDNAGDCDDFSCEEDPRPSPLQPPYEPGGVVDCGVFPVCPCGPSGVNCP